MLSGRNITKSFGAIVALNDIDLDIQPGRITVMVGSSGSGKTSLLRCMALLDTPDQGKIYLDGELVYPLRSSQKSGGQAIYPKVTAVFQDLALWPHLTLRQNILLPIKLNNVQNDERYVDNLVDRLGMIGFIDRYPNEVSRGQRQRVAFARALALRPKYLLLDEITSSLDVEQIAVILEVLRELRHSGMAIFVITHLLGFARGAADVVVALDGGRIIESGGPEILDNARSLRLKDFLRTVQYAS